MSDNNIFRNNQPGRSAYFNERRTTFARELRDRTNYAQLTIRRNALLAELEALNANITNNFPNVANYDDNTEPLDLPSLQIARREETDIKMKAFIEQLDEACRDTNADTVNNVLMLINGEVVEGPSNDPADGLIEIAYYDILKFFVLVYNGLDADFLPVNDTIYADLPAYKIQGSFEAWQKSVVGFIRSSGMSDDEKNIFIMNPTNLLYRVTRKEAEFAMKLIADTFRRMGVERSTDVVNHYIGKSLFSPTAGVDGIDDAEQRAISNAIALFSQARLDLLWFGLLLILKTMKMIISKNITSTDVILAQNNYRQVRRYVSNGVGYINAIQAFPLILCPPVEGQFDIEDAFIYKDLYDKFGYLVRKFFNSDSPLLWEPRSLWIKIKVKRLFTQTDDNHNISKEIKYIVFTIYPIESWIEEYSTNTHTPTITEAIYELRNNEGYFTLFLKLLLKDELEKNRTQTNYNDYDLLSDSDTIDMASIMIINTQISKRVNGDIDVDPNSEENIDFIRDTSTIRRPAYCSTASEMLIKNTAMFSECSSIGICLYEALFTYRNVKNILSKAKAADGTPYWKRECRLKLLLRSLHNENQEMKDMVLLGQTESFLEYCARTDIQTFVWEGESDPYDLDDSLPTLLIFSRHCVCSDTGKLKKEYRNKANRLNKKVDEPYICRKLETPDKLPEQLNYYLDIETSIDSSGKFTPYLICVIGNGEKHSWWGFGTCKEHFLQWLEKKIDKDYKVSVAHKKAKPPVSIWTYNGMKFDLIFLVRGMVNLPHFDIKGSCDNIKALEVCNVTFRDLLKIIPIGSLRKQSEFWKTEHRKGEEDFDEITDDFIRRIDQAGNGCIEAQEESFYLDKRKGEIIEYCYLDCLVLQECVEAYIQWIWESLKITPYVISAAGLALKYFQTHHHASCNRPANASKTFERNITGVSPDVYDAIKTSYKGGIVMNTRLVNHPMVLERDYVPANLPENHQMLLLDINSSYPNAMMRDIPYKLKGEVNYQWNHPDIIENDMRFTDWFLYGVIGLEWNEGTRIPTIPKRTSEGLNHTLKHSYIDYIWGVELTMAKNTGNLKCGKIFKVYQFESYPMFRSYVEELYGKRRKLCKETGDTQGDKIYKILLNSLYGKFGQKLYPTKKIVDSTGLLYYAHLIVTPPEYIGEGLYSIVINDGDEETEFTHDPEELERRVMKKGKNKGPGYAVHVASYIAMLGRFALMKGVSDVGGYESVAYMDTDSMLIFNKGPLKPYEVEIDPSKLGAWDIERKNIHTFISPAKKMYYIEGINDDGSTYSICKSKGLAYGSMKKEDYIKIIKEGHVDNLDGGSRWKRKEGYVFKEKNVKSVKLGSNREFYNDGMDSHPLIE